MDTTTCIEDKGIAVRLVLGGARWPAEGALALCAGDVVELDHGAGDPVDVYAGDRLVARGEAVMVGACWGVRVREVLETV